MIQVPQKKSGSPPKSMGDQNCYVPPLSTACTLTIHSWFRNPLRTIHICWDLACLASNLSWHVSCHFGLPSVIGWYVSTCCGLIGILMTSVTLLQICVLPVWAVILLFLAVCHCPIYLWTFFELPAAENFAFTTRITVTTVILTL